MKPVENMSFVGSEFPVWKSLVFVVAQELFSKELFFHLFLVSVWKRHENAAQEEGCLVLHCFKEKTYKMKAWTGSASRIPHQVPTAKGRAADPGCSQLHPAASPCSSRTKRLSRTHREVWKTERKTGRERQTGRQGGLESSKWIPCSQLAQMPQPLPKGLCLGWDRKAGPQLCYGQPQKTATTPLQCAVIPWCDISKPKLSSRSSFNFNVFYPSNQNNFFFNYL